jgi:predicted CoA-binding protein
MDDEKLRDILTAAKVIAVVGFSDQPDRASYQIGHFLRQAGYTIYPVNPAIKEVGDMVSYPSLAAVPEHIDIVDVFRQPQYLPGIVEEAAAVGAGLVWGQLGVVSAEAARKADELGIPLVMNRCIKVDYLHWIGR